MSSPTYICFHHMRFPPSLFSSLFSLLPVSDYLPLKTLISPSSFIIHRRGFRAVRRCPSTLPPSVHPQEFQAKRGPSLFSLFSVEKDCAWEWLTISGCLKVAHSNIPHKTSIRSGYINTTLQESSPQLKNSITIAGALLTKNPFFRLWTSLSFYVFFCAEGYLPPAFRLPLHSGGRKKSTSIFFPLWHLVWSFCFSCFCFGRQGYLPPT